MDYAPQFTGRGANGRCLIQGSPTPTLLVPSTRPRHTQSLWPCLGFHLLLSRGDSVMQKNGFGVGARPAKLSKHSSRKEECGARPGQSKNSSGPAAHSSASFGTARSQAFGQAQAARAVREPETVQGWQDRVCGSPQAPSAVLGLGTPVSLEILKSASEGAERTPGTCWGSSCSSFPAHCFSLSLSLSLEESKAEVPLPRASPAD